MARKSIIKDICDIFESDSTAKSPTFTKYCDLGQALNINDNQQYDKIMNKTKITSSQDSQNTSTSMNNTKLNNNNEHKLSSIKDRISKLNIETPSKTSSNTSSNRPKSNTISRRSVIPKELAINNVKYKKNNTLPVRRAKVGRLNLSNFDNISGEFKSFSPSPTTPKSPRRFSNFPNRMSLHKTHLDKRNSKTPSTLTSPTPKDELQKLESPKRNRKNAAVFPEIPAKPKYINKIKLHPNLSVKSRNDLQDKINKFNNLATTTNEADARNSTTNLDTKHETTIKKNNSKTDLYDLIINPHQNRLKPKTPKPAISPKPLPKSPTSPETYDVVQKSNLNNLKPLKALPEQDQEEPVYHEIVDPGDKTNKNKCVQNLKSAKNMKNFKAMSKDHSLEGDGYIVVVDENKTPPSDDSSDEDIATEYDVIENLNVTKITVERRYKVPNNEEENSTFNVKRETYYDHNLNPRIELISRQVQKVDEGDEACGNPCNTKSAMIIQELLQTELAYFKGLLKVYEDYIVYFKESPDLRSPNINKVFGNFEDIYKLQIDFYGQLTECHNNVDGIAETFLKNAKLFELYEKYILNKQVSLKYSTGECLQVIQDRDKQLGNTLNLESYLLTPFQRLIRYRMLLKTLHETLQAENSTSTMLEEAINYLEGVIDRTNLQVKVMQDIENCPIDLTKRGKLLMVDDCYLKHNGKRYYATVILFEDVIIFTRKNETEKYNYKGSINLVDLYIRSITEEDTSFQLQNFTKYKLKHDNKYVYDLEVNSPKSKQDWVAKIQTLLWNQFAAHKRS